jgi:serine/threonine protein phosphatase PrpC
MGDNFFGITDTGKQRVNNEDRYIAKAVFNGQFVLACVIDGVGGYVGGEIAAQLTADAITNGLAKLPANITRELVAILENANERIIREKELNPQHDKMACVVTLALVDIAKNIFYFAHVGDTRLYLFRDGSLIKITRDHSAVGFLEESGRLTEEAAMSHPKRNEVNKALGYETQLGLSKDFIDTGESPFLPGDTLLLCSDGLTDMIPASRIVSVLSAGDGLSSKAKSLVKAANEAGGNDNITVVLVRNHKSPAKLTVTRPSAAPGKHDVDNGNADTKTIVNATDAGAGADHTGRSVKRNGVLIIICLVILLAVLLWLFRKYKAGGMAAAQGSTIAMKQRTKTELDFLDSLGSTSGNELRLTAAQQITLSDTVLLSRDSFRIYGNGSRFICDSAYNGPAFLLAPSCKYVLLDSIYLQGFKIAIEVAGKGLHLKNVRFEDCAVPIVFQQHLMKDSSVSGRQADSFLYALDSLKK